MEATVTKGFQGKGFKLGTLVMTRGVNDRVANDEAFAKFVMLSVRRHATQDWGDLPDEDREMNDRAVKRHEGRLDGRLFSVYENIEGPKIWIITEWDESVTTVLFPSEY